MWYDPSTRMRKKVFSNVYLLLCSLKESYASEIPWFSSPPLKTCMKIVNFLQICLQMCQSLTFTRNAATFWLFNLARFGWYEIVSLCFFTSLGTRCEQLKAAQKGVLDLDNDFFFPPITQAAAVWEPLVAVLCVRPGYFAFSQNGADHHLIFNTFAESFRKVRILFKILNRTYKYIFAYSSLRWK